MVELSNLGSAIDTAAATRVRAAGVPVMEGTRSGLNALRHLMDHPNRRTSPPAAHRPDLERQATWRRRLAAGPLQGDDAFALLRAYGIATPPSRAVSSAEEAAAAARAIGFPVVLKTDEPSIAHKSDVGGVVPGIADPDAAAAAYTDLATRLGPRVLVSATAPDGVELALGVVRDPHLGPLVVVGAGGVLVEFLADRSVRMPPIDEDGARDAVARLRVAALLDGVRGAAPADRDALAGTVVAVSRLAAELGDALEALDINPLRCGSYGCLALDALVECRPPDALGVESDQKIT